MNPLNNMYDIYGSKIYIALEIKYLCVWWCESETFSCERQLIRPLTVVLYTVFLVASTYIDERPM